MGYALPALFVPFVPFAPFVLSAPFAAFVLFVARSPISLYTKLLSLENASCSLPSLEEFFASSTKMNSTFKPLHLQGRMALF